MRGIVASDPAPVHLTVHAPAGTTPARVPFHCAVVELNPPASAQSTVEGRRGTDPAALRAQRKGALGPRRVRPAHFRQRRPPSAGGKGPPSQRGPRLRTAGLEANLHSGCRFPSWPPSRGLLVLCVWPAASRGLTGRAPCATAGGRSAAKSERKYAQAGLGSRLTLARHLPAVRPGGPGVHPPRGPVVAGRVLPLRPRPDPSPSQTD